MKPLAEYEVITLGSKLNRGYWAVIVLIAVAALPYPPSQASPVSTDLIVIEKLAQLALDCVHQEYPNHLSHTLQSDADVRPPRELTPAFYGCYDWHSSVHGHWLLARLARLYPDRDFAVQAHAALAHSLSKENLLAESAYIEGKGRRSFERPYGIAWLLQLAAELDASMAPEAKQWRDNIRPLEAALIARLTSWLPNLTYPVRSGTHSQTAFALGLALDWARTTNDTAVEAFLIERIETLYQTDIDCPIGYEPSGADFLSPCLAEADLMRRVLAPAAFATWLDHFLTIPTDAEWLVPAFVSDRSDPHLVHLDGLNLSRAWMLEGIASGLPETDSRVSVIQETALRHRLAGLEGISSDYYEGGHWLGSFATYLVTQRGLTE